VAVATLGVAEGFLMERLRRLAVALFERDRHDRLDATGRPAVPSEREHEPLVADDLAIDAAEPALAVLLGLDHRAVGAAHAKVHLDVGAREPLGAHPVFHVLGVGPQREHGRRRSVERARDQELVIGESCGHRASPFF
jgi:hypothetical protein